MPLPIAPPAGSATAPLSTPQVVIVSPSVLLPSALEIDFPTLVRAVEAEITAADIAKLALKRGFSDFCASACLAARVEADLVWIAWSSRHLSTLCFCNKRSACLFHARTAALERMMAPDDEVSPAVPACDA